MDQALVFGTSPCGFESCRPRFEYGSVAQMDRERRPPKAKAASSSLAGVTCFVGLAGYDSGPVNRKRWFESSTKLFGVRISGFDVQGSEFRVPGAEFGSWRRSLNSEPRTLTSLVGLAA